MQASPKTVALVDWNRAGHHRTYFSAFASALLECGARVVPLCPWPDELAELMAGTPSAGNPEVMARLEAPSRCLWPTAGWVRPESLKPYLCTLKHFRDIGKALDRWEQAKGGKVDLVFFCCIYDRDFRHFRLARPLFRRPWSGLYLDSRAVRMPGTPNPYNGQLPCPERILSSPGLQSVAHLDEGILPQLQTMTGGKPVFWMPDVADTTLPGPGAGGEDLGAKIRAFAGGRKVVGCIGHLQKTKGILNLVRAAADPRLADVCFAFVGEVNWYPHTAAEQEEIMRAWEGNPRIFVHPLRVPDGPRLNSAVAACDVIAAAYTDFPNSSNMLTKAAAFGKPVVVHEGHLMGERVKRHQLGLAIAENDQDALISNLCALVDNDSRRVQVGSTSPNDFLLEHSYAKLVSCFHKITQFKSSKS